MSRSTRSSWCAAERQPCTLPHREANTLGSKSAALELTAVSVDMKVLIEQMREQVQNIE